MASKNLGCKSFWSRKLIKATFTAFTILAGSLVTADSLKVGFESPPAEVRPRVWWHWLNGAISEEGIRKDLEWMHKVGISGVQIFSGSMPNNDAVVDAPLIYMSPPWKHAFRVAVNQASKFDMEVTIPTSAGWSQTGASFVKPQDAMKKLVWSEIELEGGRLFEGKLPIPPVVSGPFSTIPINNRTLLGEGIEVPQLYADSNVVAYRVPDAEPAKVFPRVSTASGDVAAEGLFDGELKEALALPYPTHDRPTWIQFSYDKPVVLRSLTAVLEPKKPDIALSAQIPAWLEVQVEPGKFKKVVDLTVGAFTQNTNTFDAVKGQFFRIVFQPFPPANPMAGLDMAPGSVPQPGLKYPASLENLSISELALHSSPQVHRFEEKAGFASVMDYHDLRTPVVDKRFAIDPSKVLDISRHMQSDGKLKWKVPEGRWRILRMGYSLTGHVNGPASVEATGLEVDKLSPGRVSEYMETYIDQFELVVGADLIGKKGIQAVLNDSYEAGFGNWTDDILQQFHKRRGYSALPYLPILTGKIVESSFSSDAFLYDFRRTLAELLSESHYGAVASVAKARGMKVYGEALESGNRPTLGDGMAMRRYTTVPMGAMWTFGRGKVANPSHIADLKGAASVANLYGQRFVGAESFSSMFQPWAHSPRELKHVADNMLALGVNRFIIHSAVHQPHIDKKPGLSLWIFGQYFNRNETWADQARPWLDYLSRSSWLLAQGRYASDVAYFYGEEAPLVTLSMLGKLGDTPKKFAFDYVNAEALLSEFHVSEGQLQTRSGMSYRALQLGGSSYEMTLPVLRKLYKLVNAGAVIIGKKPARSPSLADDASAFQRLADELWSGENRTRVGKGLVVSDGKPVDQILTELDVSPSFDGVASDTASLLFHPRKLDKGALWFVSNPTGKSFKGEVVFRINGFRPELWNAETGERQAVSYRVREGRTQISLDLDASDSVFVVFREETDSLSASVNIASTRVVKELEGDWRVEFQPGRGAPEGPHSLQAGSWTESSKPGIRYFSGTAAYKKIVSLDLGQIGGQVVLDLGAVGDIAQVIVNDKEVRTLWRPPYRVDISDVVVNGDNEIEVHVTNRWVNRLIGDAQKDGKKVTWTVAPVYAPNAPLLPSGLIGPVRLLEEN